MRYDYYTKERLYKPKLTKQCRHRLYKKILAGLTFDCILDIGVGWGEFAYFCRDMGISWLGIEPNARLRNALRDDGFEVYDATMPGLPEMAQDVDAILASHVIEHMNGLTEAVQFLEECKRLLLEKNGRFLILLYPDITRNGSMFWFDYTHNFVTSKRRIECMLIDGGWTIQRSGYYVACFFRISSLLRIVGKFVPYPLLPRRVSDFARMSFQQHAFTIASPNDSGHAQ